MKIFLIRMGDYSQYIRTLIDQDRARLHDRVYIESQRKELKARLAELDREEKTALEAPVRGREVLQRWMKIFREDPRMEKGWDSNDALVYIRGKVLPDLKKAGVLNLQPAQILPMFLRGEID